MAALVWKKGKQLTGGVSIPGLVAGPKVGQLKVGGSPATSGMAKLTSPTPYIMPTDTEQWATTASAASKNPYTDLSWQDSAYNTTLANLLAQQAQGNTALQTASRRAAEDRDKNVTLLGEGRSNSKSTATKSANKQGLFYSGTLGKNLGDIDTDYDRRTSDVNTAFTRGEEDRAAQQASLTTAYNVAQQTAAQQAIDRWLGNASATETASTPSLDAIIAALTAANAKSNSRS